MFIKMITKLTFSSGRVSLTCLHHFVCLLLLLSLACFCCCCFFSAWFFDAKELKVNIITFDQTVSLFALQYATSSSLIRGTRLWPVLTVKNRPLIQTHERKTNGGWETERVRARVKLLKKKKKKSCCSYFCKGKKSAVLK